MRILWWFIVRQAGALFLLPARLCHIWDTDLARDKKNPQIGARRHSREKIQGHTDKISPNRYKET